MDVYNNIINLNLKVKCGLWANFYPNTHPGVDRPSKQEKKLGDQTSTNRK